MRAISQAEEKPSWRPLDRPLQTQAQEGTFYIPLKNSTFLYQGIHGEENTQKRRAHKKITGATRSVGSTTLESILAKRNQKPEFRKAQRDAAVKAAKDANKAVKEAKKVATKAAAKVRVIFIYIYIYIVSV